MMNDFWQTVDFCPVMDEVSTNVLAEQLVRILFDNRLYDIIHGKYNELISSYGGCEDRFFTVPAASYNASQMLRKHFDSCDRTGSDLPVWVKLKNLSERDCTKRIMIVAERPLRNTEAGKGFSLSTPFGMHTPMNEKNNEIVIELVKELLCKKALVYLTDSIKIYFSNDACNSKECYCACRAIFDFEMKRFNPDVVLAFGEVATKAAVLQFFNPRFVANAVSDNPIQFPKCQVWSLVHPSKRTLSKVMEELDVDTDATVGNRTQYVLTNYYKKVIEQIFGIDKLEKKH